MYDSPGTFVSYKNSAIKDNSVIDTGVNPGENGRHNVGWGVSLRSLFFVSALIYAPRLTFSTYNVSSMLL